MATVGSRGGNITMDPFDFDTYFLQRMNEFFGQDFESLFPTFPPVAVRPEPKGGSSRIEEKAGPGGSRAWIEAPEKVIEVDDAPEQLSRRQLRRIARQFIPIDIMESEDGYVVEANLPGISKENIDAYVDHNNVLTIDTRPTPSVVHACQLKNLKGGEMENPNATQSIEPKPSHQEAPKSSGEGLPTPKESPSKEPTKQHQPPSLEETQHRFLLGERYKGRLHRSIRLPKNADPKKVSSCIENGVLCLSFAKIPGSQLAHRIEL